MDIAWPSALTPGGVPISGIVTVKWEEPERLDVIEVLPVEVQGHAEAHGDLMELAATLKTKVVYRCVRCLAPFSGDLSTSLKERFSRVPSGNDEEETVFIEAPIIHLDPYVEQALLLSLEHHPVCRADCKGLCFVCGADLNSGECGCNRTPLDPRLEVLSQMLDEMKKNEGSE